MVRFKPKQPHQHDPLEFPKGFLWGTATSAHQVEGWNDNNDWWNWEHLPGKIADGQMSGRGPDHYHHFKKDFNLIERLYNNSHRLSLEWSRINPRPGYFDEKQIKHYRQVLSDLKGRGVKVMLTLHHFTNPIWFAEAGAFEKKKNIGHYERYVEFVVQELGDLVDFWITINEPNIYTMMSYLFGIWPPGKRSKLAAFRVFDHLALAHKLAYKAIKNHYPDAQVGIAQNTISFYIYNKRSIGNWLSARFADWVWNHWFYEKTEGYHDFLGINYYVHKRVKGFGFKSWEMLVKEDEGEGREKTDLQWEIFAPGFYDALANMSTYGLPIYVTENGISTLNDDERARYLISYLKELYHALQAGIDVRGYFYWSLMDNFEWDKGYKSKFGLVEIDFRTLKRTMRGTAKIYARICQSNRIDHDLLRFVGHGVSPDDVLKKK